MHTQPALPPGSVSRQESSQAAGLSLAEGPELPSWVIAARKGHLENLLGLSQADISASGPLGLPALQLGNRTSLLASPSALSRSPLLAGSSNLRKV